MGFKENASGFRGWFRGWGFWDFSKGIPGEITLTNFQIT